MRVCAIALLIVLGSASAQAADPNGQFKAIGAGSLKCQQYSAATDDQKRFADTWMAGYITAISRMTPDTWDITGGTPFDNVKAMFAQFCSSNPDVAIANALHQVLQRLHPNRIRKSPN